MEHDDQSQNARTIARSSASTLTFLELVPQFRQLYEVLAAFCPGGHAQLEQEARGATNGSMFRHVWKKWMRLIARSLHPDTRDHEEHQRMYGNLSDINAQWDALEELTSSVHVGTYVAAAAARNLKPPARRPAAETRGRAPPRPKSYHPEES